MEEILIICSTNRQESVSKTVSHIYQEILKKNQVNSQIIDLIDLPRDFVFSALYDQSGKNHIFNKFNDEVKLHRKMVFIVPEYNGSFPGVLKAFIDGLEYPGSFQNKFCALVGLSSGVQGAGLALSHLTDIFNYCGMQVIAQKPKLSSIETHLVNGKVTNRLYLELLEEQVQVLISIN